VLFCPSIINNVGLSLLNNQHGLGDERRYRRIFWFNVATNAVIVMAGAAVVTFAGPWVLSVFGREFHAGYRVLVILMLATIPETLAVAAVQPLQSQDRVWTVFLAVILPCYSTLVLVAFALTPMLGASGLAWAYVAGWGVGITSAVFLVCRFGIWHPTADRRLLHASHG